MAHSPVPQAENTSCSTTQTLKNVHRTVETLPRAAFSQHPSLLSPPAPGPSGALPGVVQDIQSERIAGRYRQIVPETSGLHHAHPPAIRSQFNRRQREHGPPLQCVTFKLPRGQTAAGYRWDANTHTRSEKLRWMKQKSLNTEFMKRIEAKAVFY